MQILLSFVLVFAMIGLMVPNAFSATSTFYEGEEKIILEKNIDVNLVLIGDSWLSSQVTAIKKDLVETYEPIYVLTNKKVGIQYNFEYNFLTVTEEDSKKLLEKFEEKSSLQGLNGPIEWWLHTYQGIPFEEQDEVVEKELLLQYDAEYVEEQIYEIIIKDDSNLSSNDNINLVFLGSSDYFPWAFWKNYFIEQKDSSTDTQFTKLGLTGYGGNYNFYYFDLYAIPWIEFDIEGFYNNMDDSTKWFHTPLGMGNLHDCTAASCLSEIIVDDVNSAIHHIATPSFVYPVDYYPNYLVDLVVYNAPMGSSTGVTKSTLPYFVNEDKVISELNKLYPFANFEMDVSTERRDTRGISLDFKDAIKSMNHEILENPFLDYNYSTLNSKNIKPHLIEWAQERIGAKNIENTKTIPVILVVHDSSRDLFIDDYGTTGYAPGMPEDETISCCAFAVMHEDEVWENKMSGTDLVIHEVGHTLGLVHPFQTAIGEHYEYTENNFWNNYASPMTYGSVPNGCGFLFEILHPDEICGLADRSFTVFETNAITNMAVVSLIKKTDQNINLIDQFEVIGKSDSDKSKLKIMQNSLSNAKTSFNAGQILEKNGAIDNAKYAYFESNEMLGIKIVDTEPKVKSDQGIINLTVDSVVYDKYKPMATKISGKVNDEIFSRGQPVMISVEGIDLSEPIVDGYKASLLTGMEYTSHYDEIKVIPTGKGEFSIEHKFPVNSGVGKYEITAKHMNKLIGVEIFEITQNLEDKFIPSWVKNNAGWWAEGQIGQMEFVRAIEFLIEVGIISIPNLSEIISEQSESECNSTSWDDMTEGYPEDCFESQVPAWIKNNAGWWAEGQIDDNAFVQGIEYLVKLGIIQVN